MLYLLHFLKQDCGIKKLATLAVFINLSPDLLLLDEPFSSLDWQTREHIWHEVKSLTQALQITTLLVTHEPKEADFLAERQVRLHLGQFI